MLNKYRGIFNTAVNCPSAAASVGEIYYHWQGWVSLHCILYRNRARKKLRQNTNYAGRQQVGIIFDFGKRSTLTESLNSVDFLRSKCPQCKTCGKVCWEL